MENVNCSRTHLSVIVDGCIMTGVLAKAADILDVLHIPACADGD